MKIVKEKSLKATLGLLLGAVIVTLLDVSLVSPHVIFQPIESQTVYYSLLAVALAVALGALVEYRLTVIERKLDEFTGLRD
jgi:hypothetical protein